MKKFAILIVKNNLFIIHSFFIGIGVEKEPAFPWITDRTHFLHLLMAD
jgi:hypothetical protein